MSDDQNFEDFTGRYDNEAGGNLFEINRETKSNNMNLIPKKPILEMSRTFSDGRNKQREYSARDSFRGHFDGKLQNKTS